MKPTSRAEYLRRIDRAMEHLSTCIEQRQPLPSIAQLAAHAHLSEFHFMRVYRALAGEALGATVQRLRLERSVHLLTQTSMPIIEIAASVGYETPQAFAKAFRQKFEAAPTDVRERPESYVHRVARPSGSAPHALVRVQIVQLQPFRAAVLRNHGAYTDLDQAYARLFGWMAERGALDSIRGIWGVPHHDRRDTAPEDTVFDCCLATDAPLRDEGGVRMARLGGGRYAVHRHIGSYSLLDDAHDALLREALPDAELMLRAAPILHRFINEPDNTPESALETHIFIPIE